MDQQEGLATNRPPLFTWENYALCSVRMRCHLMSLGCKVWSSVQKEYKVQYNLPTDRDELDQYESNAKALNAILTGLTNSLFVKVMQCKTTRHAWEKLKTVYKGVSKVKQSKLHTYKGHFESLKMKEEENIVEYLIRVYKLSMILESLQEK